MARPRLTRAAPWWGKSHVSWVDRLDQVTGIGRDGAQALIAEVGPNMAQFPTGAQLPRSHSAWSPSLAPSGLPNPTTLAASTDTARSARQARRDLLRAGNGARSQAQRTRHRHRAGRNRPLPRLPPLASGATATDVEFGWWQRRFLDAGIGPTTAPISHATTATSTGAPIRAGARLTCAVVRIRCSGLLSPKRHAAQHPKF